VSSSNNTAVATNRTTAEAGQQVYHESAAHRDAYNQRRTATDASHLVPHLRPGMRVVDFGCGAGSLSLGFAAIVAPGQVVGFDQSEPAIEQARAEAGRLGLTNTEFHLADINTLELASDSFDVAHFSGVLAYQKHPLAALKLAYRVLKRGGLVAAREPQKEGDWFGGPNREIVTFYNQILVDDRFRSMGGDPFIGRRLAALFQEAGFEKVLATPGYAPAFSDPHAIAAAIIRFIGEGQFSARILEHDWLSAEQLAGMPEAVRVWGESDASVAAFAECMAIGRKAA
jgi:ubiquinone/menaquinone biosynthesis C-methylase UbiE